MLSNNGFSFEQAADLFGYATFFGAGLSLGWNVVKAAVVAVVAKV